MEAGGPIRVKWQVSDEASNEITGHLLTSVLNTYSAKVRHTISWGADSQVGFFFPNLLDSGIVSPSEKSKNRYLSVSL